MPFSYKFLIDEFNSQHTIDDIGIKAPHRDIKLEDLRIDFDKAYKQLLDLINGIESDDLNSAINTGIKKAREELADDNSNRLDSQEDSETNKKIMDEENTDTIFTENLLMNKQFLADINEIIYEALDQIHPSQQLRLQMYNHTYDFWHDPSHNSWTYLKDDLFSDRPDLYDEVTAIMKQRIGQLKEG